MATRTDRNDPSSITQAEVERLLQVAEAAATIGGEVLTRYFRDGVVIRDKSATGGASYDLVSDADLESERRIGETIAAAFPDHQLLGEESLGRTLDVASCDHLWVIDPLDGTNNFAHGLPHFAVSIAYYRFGKPIVGVVFNPIRDDWYMAATGRGAEHNGRSVTVCQSQSLTETLVGCGFYYDRGEMMRCTLRAIEDFFSQDVHGIRRFGTASLDLCMVGCGQLGGFFEYRLSPWDFAAGRLFVEQAGGRVTTASGDALKLETSCLLASNGRLHEAMLAITRRHHPATRN